jgi:hypothetical protein
MTYRNVSTSAVLAAGVAQQIVGPNYNRYELTIQNTGTGNITIGFGSAPSAPGAGLSLDGASSAGGQGGVRIWGQPTRDPHFDHYYEAKDVGDAVPSQSIWALSAAGSTVVVVESLP